MIKLTFAGHQVKNPFGFLPTSDFKCRKRMADFVYQSFRNILETKNDVSLSFDEDVCRLGIQYREGYGLVDGSHADAHFSIFSEEMEFLGRKESPSGDFEAGLYSEDELIFGLRIT